VREIAYETLEEANLKETAPEELPFSIDEKALLSQNPEYRMWITIPGTNIDYPAVQHEDNLYYLDHDFLGEEQISGSIFLDKKSTASSKNTILYGHNMKDGTMFADLKKYRDRAYWEEHPCLRIYRNGQWLECPIFSCQLKYETDAAALRTEFLPGEWEDYLREMSAASLYDTGICPDPEKRILTLSTCYGSSERMLVQAVLP
jgi:SrtB family sortase